MRRLLAVLTLTLTATLTAEPLHMAPFARDLGDARNLLKLDDGTILVSRPSTFDVIALRDRDRDGTADEIRTAISSVEGASGLAFHDGTLFVVGSKRIVAADRLPDGSFAPWREVVTDLPDGGFNAQRPLAVGPDGRIYVGIAEQGLLWQIERNGLTRRVYARGLSDLAGIAFDDKGTARAVPKSEIASLDVFIRDNAVLRMTAEPPSMLSASTEPTRTILAKAFELRDLRDTEAVLHDEEQDIYFVAGKGFVARVSPEGKVLEAKFIDGIRNPRGMTIREVELWITDGTNVRVYNRVTGLEVRTLDLKEHGAVDLHHLAVGGDGAVYVTDTNRRNGDGRIFRIEGDGDVEVAIHGEELRSPAGIAWDGTRFLVAQAYGNEIMGWQPGHATTAVLRGPGAYDGLTILPNGVVIASSQNDDALHFGTTGDLKPLFSRSPAPAGIAFDRKRNRLLMANGGFEAWTLPPMIQPASRSAKERPVDMATNVIPKRSEEPGRAGTR